MRSAKADARLAGILYLLSGLMGVFSYLYVPGALVVRGDAIATARNITDASLLYRMGILSDVTGQIVLIFAVLVLYGLFREIDRKYARLMVIMVVVGATVEFANVFNLMAPLILLSGARFFSVFTSPQLDALALGFLSLRDNASNVVQVFWGLWLFPFGILVIKSGFFPKILGRGLIFACFAYLVASAAFILSLSHLIYHPAQYLGGLAEEAMILWLIVKGANVPKRAESAVSVQG